MHLFDGTQPPPETYWIEDLGYRYVYTENNGNKVNIFRDGLFYTLYDFDAQVNDVWTTVSSNYSVNCTPDNTGQIRVISKGIEDVNLTNLEYIEVQTLSGSGALLYGKIYKYISKF